MQNTRPPRALPGGRLGRQLDQLVLTRRLSMNSGPDIDSNPADSPLRVIAWSSELLARWPCRAATAALRRSVGRFACARA